MSAYTEALRRYRAALAASQAAPGDTAAAAELAAADRYLLKFAIDPYYNPSRERVTA